MNTQNNHAIWILAIIVVLALGVLIGLNMKGPKLMINSQQGAVFNTQVSKPNSDVCKINLLCKENGNPASYCDNLYPCNPKSK